MSESAKSQHVKSRPNALRGSNLWCVSYAYNITAPYQLSNGRPIKTLQLLLSGLNNFKKILSLCFNDRLSRSYD